MAMCQANVMYALCASLLQTTATQILVSWSLLGYSSLKGLSRSHSVLPVPSFVFASVIVNWWREKLVFARSCC